MRDRDSVNCFYSVTNLIANCHDNYKIIPTDLKCQADISYETQRRGRDLDVGRPIGSPLGDWGQIHSKRHLLVGSKSMANLDSILKSRDITLLTKINKAMAFPVVMCGCENWTIKEGEPFGAFKLSWCFQTVVLEKTLESPWTARRSNQSIQKEINPEYSLEGLCWSWSPMLWPPDVKNWLTGKDSDARKDWGQKEKRAAEDEMAGEHHQPKGH